MEFPRGLPLFSRSLDAGWYLRSAAQSDDTALLAAALADGGRVDEQDDAIGSPMHYAARHGSLGVLAALATLGANVDAANARGETPLMLSASAGMDGAIRRLHHLGATIESTDAHGANALVHAVLYGHTSTAKLLITEFGADANTDFGDRGVSLLSLAASRMDLLTLKTLVLHGGATAEPSNYLPRQNGATALDFATQMPHPILAPMLAWFADIDTFRATFIGVVLCGVHKPQGTEECGDEPDEQGEAQCTTAQCQLAKLDGLPGVPELIAEYAGVVTGRQLAHVRAVQQGCVREAAAFKAEAKLETEAKAEAAKARAERALGLSQ